MALIMSLCLVHWFGQTLFWKQVGVVKSAWALDVIGKILLKKDRVGQVCHEENGIDSNCFRSRWWTLLSGWDWSALLQEPSIPIKCVYRVGVIGHNPLKSRLDWCVCWVTGIGLNSFRRSWRIKTVSEFESVCSVGQKKKKKKSNLGNITRCKDFKRDKKILKGCYIHIMQEITQIDLCLSWNRAINK